MEYNSNIIQELGYNYNSNIIQELGYNNVFELLNSKGFLKYLNNKYNIQLDDTFNNSYVLKNINNMSTICGKSILHINFIEYINHLIRKQKLLKITNNIKNKC
jgi:hypothetical protein